MASWTRCLNTVRERPRDFHTGCAPVEDPNRYSQQGRPYIGRYPMQNGGDAWDAW